MSYLRMTVGRWKVDLDNQEGQDIFRRVQEEGASVFRAQPGFVNYRLMLADNRTTIAVAQWESEELGLQGAQRFRQWLAESGIGDLLTLETYAGPLVVQTAK